MVDVCPATLTSISTMTCVFVATAARRAKYLHCNACGVVVLSPDGLGSFQPSETRSGLGGYIGGSDWSRKGLGRGLGTPTIPPKVGVFGAMVAPNNGRKLREGLLRVLGSLIDKLWAYAKG